MKVLVLGQGGREHAIVHRLAHSPSVTEVHVAPGNSGMKRYALCHDFSWKDQETLIQFCLRTEIEVVIIGPEDPLVAGVADALRERGLLVVGPSAEGARLEGSKIHAKEFMTDAGIPTAAYAIVDTVEGTLQAAAGFTPPYVLKADGLAAGKGVAICKTIEELKNAATDYFDKKIFGAAGERALLEQFTPGWELSYLILTNGTESQALPIAQDHKRLLDGDEGPNTGGMGTIAPIPIDPSLREQIESRIVQPTLKELTKRGTLFRGFVFFGIMVTPEGPSLLEYNTRLGDPETQVILPLIQDDFGLLMKDLSRGKLRPLNYRPVSAACVILASPGYPDAVKKGVEIRGDIFEETDQRYFLVAGAQQTPQGPWVTDGGRCLCAIGLGDNLKQALDNAYAQSTHAKWDGQLLRRDIGKKFLT
ncbi:MAG: phosphoribosylamine--glycine ligase [Bdellovibrionaceae bacterium]|nr:phosphoribosylamine--glycine ligase [Pseudobdellovibrionaceae bacterium]